NDDGPVSVPTGPVQQRGRGLNEALPDLRLFLLNNRTPDCFQRFVREPKLPAVKQLPGVLEVTVAILGIHVGRSDCRTVNRFSAPWQLEIVPRRISTSPSAPACATSRSPARTASAENI